MSDKQAQKAGDNSSQVQANTINVYNTGLTEERAREVAKEVFVEEENKLTIEAQSEAYKRFISFENILIPRIQQIEGALEKFADPDFQMALKEADKTAIRTEKKADYVLLSELLANRVEHGDDRHIKVGLDRAVEIVDNISQEALEALTVVYAIKNCFPTDGNVINGLDSLNDLMEKLLFCDLPNNFDWMDDLDILDAIRVNQMSNLKKMDQYYLERMNGYVVAGISKESDNYDKATNILTISNLPVESLLITNELLPGYVRISISNRDCIKDLNIEKDGVSTKLDNNQEKALYQILDMYSSDKELLDEVKENFIYQLQSRDSLKMVKEWWDAIPYGFLITTAGNALAYANAKRLFPTLPNIYEL